ncbi:MAG: hypothetical protein NXI32_27995, partial [bacterium]|nr:hypothetical protein [bacterium]
MARFRKNPRKDTGHRLQSLWKWPARRLGTAWRHWGLDVRIPALVEGLSKFNYRLLQFRGTEYTVLEAGGAERVREWPSKATLLNPLWWLFWSAQFFWRWLRTRRLLPLLLATPSLAALSLFVVVYTSGLHVSPGMESLRYKAALARAVNQEDFATALLCSKVLLRANPDS